VYTLEVYRGLFEDQDYYFKSRGADVRDLVEAHHRDALRDALKRGQSGIEGVLREVQREAGG
jgi:hypothetical protein